MRAENLLSSKLYGFIDGRSTTTQLLSYLDKCIDTIVSGGVADTIYFDIAKAFDSVPHERLLRKLKSYVSMVICSKVILFVIYNMTCLKLWNVVHIFSQMILKFSDK